MDLKGDKILSNLLILILTLITLVVLYFKYAYTYWSKRNVITITLTFPFGNFGPYIRQKISIGEQVKNLYNQLKHTGKTYAGIYIFAKPVLLLLDPELCKSIMTKDFTHFMARNTYTDEKHEPITGHLINLNGTKWKNMRSKLTPTFTSGKMKMMFQTLVACSKELEVILDRYIKTGESMDVKDTMGRFTTDIIGSCAFGIDCNSLKEPDNVFRKYGRRIFEVTKADVFKVLLSKHLPALFVLLGLKRVPHEASDFFMKVVKDTVAYRENKNVFRKDFLQLLMQLKSQGFIDGEDTKTSDMRLTVEEITAQCFVFFLAGFETSSTTMSSFMYEMALHQDIQDKTRKEINDVLNKHDGKLSYESLMEMTYLEKVIDETMRLHSVAPLIDRCCTSDYQVPNSDLIIKKGTIIFIPVKAFHDDPEYYSNPKVFDPERFNVEEKEKRHPYVFLPFGAGPRNCIGLRFGMMQMKVGLATLLKNHRFTLNPKTQTPLKQDPKCNLYSILGGIWVDAKRVN